MWDMITRVLQPCVSRGHAPLLAFIGIIYYALSRMSQDGVDKTVFEVVNGLKRGYFIGYLLFIVAVIGWYAHARWQRKIIDAEMRRISDERTRLQKLITDGDMESTEE